MRAMQCTVLLAATVALTGCSTINVKLKADKPCGNDDECSVAVEPWGGDWVPGTIVTAKGKTRRIAWTLRPFEGAFAENGIRFDEAGARVFKCERTNFLRFVCENSGEAGKFKYTIQLIGWDPLDPWVLNQ
jgi:hypothetical protein